MIPNSSKLEKKNEKKIFKWEMILLAVIWKSLEIGSDFF